MALKRLTYISRAADGLSPGEIDSIGEISRRNNRQVGLTGVLFSVQNIFYQTLEGEAREVDRCYERILKDPRHNRIFCLKMEDPAPERWFPEWDMKTVALDAETQPLAVALRHVLDTLVYNHDIFEIYAPHRIVEAMRSGLDPGNLAPAASERTVLFSDVLSFTTFTETLSPAAVMDILDHYYYAFTARLMAAGGEIMRLNGDGIAASFPANETDAAVEACLAALRDLETTRAFASRESCVGLLYAGVGMASGRVIETNIGADARRDFTLLGDVVNTASRLQDATRKAGRSILLSGSAADRLQRTPVKKIGRMRPRGKTEEIELFSPDDAIAGPLPDKAELNLRIRALASAGVS